MILNGIKGAIYDIIGYLACLGKASLHDENKALVLRVDEIGD